MTARLTILASGSAGNSTLVECDGERWLIDLGLEPKELDARLAAVGAEWSQIRGVLVTHRHSDHWTPKSLSRCWTSRVPVYCHRDHAAMFRTSCPDFADLERERLFRPFVGERQIAISANWHCRPFRVRHDGGATFGFRFESPRSAFAYAADLGCWDRGLLERLVDVELLALEFNHDADLLRQSSRPPWLVHRILGDEGHLSNAQACELVGEVLKQSKTNRLQQLVLLHISRECNSCDLAAETARAALARFGSEANVFAAEQQTPSPWFVIGESLAIDRVVPPASRVQAMLF
ncbi:MAG: MBL fold metallo-hydrolase [Planctomycetaceae bacterium]